MSEPGRPANRWGTAGRLTLGFLLLAAGILKADSGDAGAEALANYRLFPAQVNQIVSVLLPWWDMGSGVLLVSGLWVRACARFATLLFSGFALAIASALIRGLDIDCGCFGSGLVLKVGMRHLMVDLVFLALAIGVSRHCFELGPGQGCRS